MKSIALRNVWPLVILLFGLIAPVAHAAADSEDIKAALNHIDETVTYMEQHDGKGSAEAFRQVKKWWSANKQTVKQQSLDMSTEIDRQVALVSLALVSGDDEKAEQGIKQLKDAMINYRDGAYTGNDGKRI